MFTAAGQTFQQQYPTGGQAISKSKFIINIFHQPQRLSVSIRISQDTFTSSGFISSENQAITQCRQSEKFCNI